MSDKELSPEVQELLAEAAAAYKKHHSLETKAAVNEQKGNTVASEPPKQGQGEKL